MKKFLSSVLAIVLLSAILAGCGQTQKETDGTSTAGTSSVTNTSGTEATTPQIDPALLEENPKDKVTVSMCMIFPELVETPKLDYVENRFGVEFEFRPVTLADWQTQVTTWVSAGDAPDLTWWDMKAAQSNQYFAWSKQGAFKPITDEMIAARPNLSELAANSISIEYLKVDGKLYYWPCFLKYPEESKSTSPGVWVYRRDWARAVGLYKEGDVYTWDEWLNLVREVVKKDPGKNGPGKTIGMGTHPWGWPNDLVLSGGSVPAIGGIGYYKGEDGKYVWSPATPEFKKEVKITQDIYNEGLVSKDNVSYKGSEAQDKFISGLEFSVYGAAVGTFASYTKEMVKTGMLPSADTDTVGGAIVEYDGSLWVSQMDDYWTGISFSSKISELAMNRVLNMYNYLASQEGGLLYFIGFKDKDYTLDGNGNIKYLWEEDPKNPGGYIAPVEYEGKMGFPLIPGTQHTDIQMKMLAIDTYNKYDTVQIMKIWNHPRKVKEIDYGIGFFTAPNKDLYGDFGTEVKTKLAELVPTSKDIEKDWDAYVASKMPQVNLVLKEINDKFGK